MNLPEGLKIHFQWKNGQKNDCQGGFTGRKGAAQLIGFWTGMA